MSAGKVLALVVVVASFAIVAFAVSWCCWCVQSCFGTGEKSIQAVKSVATVADTMESSARAVKSSLLSATFPTTATTATMTHPRATAREPGMLNPTAEADAPAKQSLPPFTNVIVHSTAESACTTPSTTGHARTPEALTTKPADNSATPLQPEAARPDGKHIWKPHPSVSDVLESRLSKTNVLIREDNTTAPQSLRRSTQPQAPGSGACGLKRARLEAGTEHASAVKVLELGDCDDENGSSIYESSSATMPSRRDSGSTKAVTGRLLCSPETEREFPHQRSTQGCRVCVPPAGSCATQQERGCRTLAVFSSSGKRSSRISTGPTSPTAECEEVIPKQQSVVPSSPHKDASEVPSAARVHITATVTEKKDVERRRSFKTPIKSEKFEGFTKDRGATTRPRKCAGENLVDKEGVKPSHSPCAGKQCLLRKAQRTAALSPRKGSGTPDVSIVINVPKKEMSLLELTKEQMLASANHCSASAKKESV